MKPDAAQVKRFCPVTDSLLSAVERQMAPFIEDARQREGGGGGRSRVLREGNVFEQAGANFLPRPWRRHACLRHGPPPRSWPDAALKPWASQLVVHPLNPIKPTQLTPTCGSLEGREVYADPGVVVR